MFLGDFKRGEERLCERRGGAFSQWDPHHPGGGGGQGD